MGQFTKPISIYKIAIARVTSKEASFCVRVQKSSYNYIPASLQTESDTSHA